MIGFLITMGKKLDLVGKKFNKLLVLSEIEERFHKKVKFKCLCDCGNLTNVNGSKLVNGWTTSCSCEHKRITSITSKLRITHGMSRTDIYKIYMCILDRCYNLKTPSYVNYGGRGITVCERWLESFDNFEKDMGERPSKLHSLDRIDNNKGYSKENCRWASDIEQANNKRSNRIILYENEEYTVADLSRLLNVDYQRLHGRLKRNNYIYKEEFNDINTTD